MGAIALCGERECDAQRFALHITLIYLSPVTRLPLAQLRKSKLLMALYMLSKQLSYAA